MEAKGIGTNYATLTLDIYEQTIIIEALTQLAERIDDEHAEDVRSMAEQIRKVRRI